jgi:hypothetical protein
MENPTREENASERDEIEDTNTSGLRLEEKPRSV